MLINILQTYIIPSVAIAIPFLFIGYRIVRENLSLVIQRQRMLRLFSVWIGITLSLFLLLLYLSSGINIYYSLQPSDPQVLGYGEFASFEWNITNRLRMYFPLYIGMNLLAVSILSGMIYATLLVLPPICVVENEIQKVSTSTLSSVTAGASAIASSVVCCSTSIIAVIAPAFGILLGPFVPGLLLGSLLLLLYSIHKVALPRIPLLPKSNANFIN